MIAFSPRQVQVQRRRLDGRQTGTLHVQVKYPGINDDQRYGLLFWGGGRGGILATLSYRGCVRDMLYRCLQLSNPHSSFRFHLV